MTTICITCSKRLSSVNRSYDNPNQCKKCFEVVARERAAANEAAALEAAREAHAARVATRHDDPELLRMAVEMALRLHSVQTNLVDTYRAIAKDAANLSEQVKASWSSWGLGSNTADAVKLEVEVRLHADTLRKLLDLMGRLGDFDAMVAEPWTFIQR